MPGTEFELLRPGDPTPITLSVEEVLLFNKFFSIVNTCVNCEDMAQQICVMVPRWRYFYVLYLQRAECSTFQTCILNSH